MPEIRICRLCLCRTPVFVSLLEANTAEMLEAVARIQVTPSEEVSTVSCVKCLLNLKLAFKTQQGILNADQKIRCEGFQTVIKQESSAEEMDPLSVYSVHLEDDGSCKSEGLQSPGLEESKESEQRTLMINRQKTQLTVAEFVSELDGAFRCEVCGKEYATRSLCRGHVYMSHIHEACSVCGKVCLKCNLGKHMLLHSETAESRTVCELCGKVFKNWDSIRRHRRLHRYRYQCGECGKEYTERKPLEDHIIKEHNDEPPQFMCDTCGKKFFTNKHLATHVFRVHRRRGNQSRSCQFCERKFSTAYALRIHTRQHTNETPYQCGECGDGFKQNVSLRTHMSSKHGIQEKRDVPCGVCDKVFASRNAVNSHMKTHKM